MGLAEKRWAAEKKSELEAGFVGAVRAAVGSDLPVEIDWDGFSNHLNDMGYIGDGSYGIQNLVTALKNVARDELGKEALREGVKSVRLEPASGAGESAFSFDDGQIVWRAYFGSANAGYIYADAMQQAIESKL